MRWLAIICLFFLFGAAKAQKDFEAHFKALNQLKLDSGVTLTFDEPADFSLNKPTKLIIFALPNGNSTGQTFGKKLATGDDWHFDIQHIGAQTEFLRKEDKSSNYVVVYVENTLKSWPAWRRKMNDDSKIAFIINLVIERYAKYRPKLTLSGHSGGGSFIFGYLNSQNVIPNLVERIGFLDATYGYETEKHQEKLKVWLKDKQKSLEVIAYNDSVVVYNGKPLVSPTGGTWYRSKMMAADLSKTFKLSKTDLSDRVLFADRRSNISFKLIKNPEAKIYHTVLVERNGFIDLMLNGTKNENKHYTFWGERAYQSFILE